MHAYLRLTLIFNNGSNSDIGLQVNIPRKNTSGSEPSEKGLRSLKNVIIDYTNINKL